MRVVTSSTTFVGKVWVVIHSVTFCTARNGQICRWVLLVTLGTTQLFSVPLAASVEAADNLLVAADTEIRFDVAVKNHRNRAMRYVTGTAIGCLHPRIMTLVTLHAGRRLTVDFVTDGAADIFLVRRRRLSHRLDHLGVTTFAGGKDIVHPAQVEIDIDRLMRAVALQTII